MVGFASLFTNFVMLKIYLKKTQCSYWLLFVNFTYTTAWLDVAQNLSIRYLSTSKKNWQIINDEWIPDLPLTKVMWLQNELTFNCKWLIKIQKHINTLNVQELLQQQISLDMAN